MTQDASDITAALVSRPAVIGYTEPQEIAPADLRVGDRLATWAKGSWMWVTGLDEYEAARRQLRPGAQVHWSRRLPLGDWLTVIREPYHDGEALVVQHARGTARFLWPPATLVVRRPILGTVTEASPEAS